jgi:hypothetical protein
MKNNSDHIKLLNCLTEIRAKVVSLFDMVKHEKSRIRIIWWHALLILHHYFTVDIISTFRAKTLKTKLSQIVVLLLLFLGNKSLDPMQIDGFLLNRRTMKPIDLDLEKEQQCKQQEILRANCQFNCFLI